MKLEIGQKVRWNDGMKLEDRVGVVVEIRPNGKVRVRQDDSTSTHEEPIIFSHHPADLRPVAE